MNTTTTTIATDDQVREYLQGEIQAALQGNGLDWLEAPIELAVEEALERPETPAVSEAEAMAGARRHIERASRAAAEGDWSEVCSSTYWLTVALYWCIGGPGRRSRELQHALDAVYDAATAAALQPWSADWRAWRGREYCTILLDQPYYSPWLYSALEAWERGADLTINGDRLEAIEAEAE